MQFLDNIPVVLKVFHKLCLDECFFVLDNYTYGITELHFISNTFRVM